MKNASLWKDARNIEDAYDDHDEYPTCVRCWGSGEIVTCIDDMCRNSDECMHGDGMSPCPDCKGKGELGPGDVATVG